MLSREEIKARITNADGQFCHIDSVFTLVFDTEDEASIAQDIYYNLFPPQGYGSSARISMNLDDKYVVRFYRQHSCD